MALIECFECGNQVSDSAATCTNCGVAIKQQASQTRSKVVILVNADKYIKG